MRQGRRASGIPGRDLVRINIPSFLPSHRYRAISNHYIAPEDDPTIIVKLGHGTTVLRLRGKISHGD